MNQLGVLQFPFAWEVSPPQDYHRQWFTDTHLSTRVEGNNLKQSFLSKETTKWIFNPHLKVWSLTTLLPQLRGFSQQKWSHHLKSLICYLSCISYEITIAKRQKNSPPLGNENKTILFQLIWVKWQIQIRCKLLWKFLPQAPLSIDSDFFVDWNYSCFAVLSRINVQCSLGQNTLLVILEKCLSRSWNLWNDHELTKSEKKAWSKIILTG